MLDSKYLYDTEIKEHGNKPYSYVLALKIHLAHKLMKKLVIDQDMRDFQRMSEVHKAINFNRTLLKEVGFDDMDIKTALIDCEQDLLI